MVMTGPDGVQMYDLTAGFPKLMQTYKDVGLTSKGYCKGVTLSSPTRKKDCWSSTFRMVIYPFYSAPIRPSLKRGASH